jgi:hypothetical protein
MVREKLIHALLLMTLFSLVSCGGGGDIGPDTGLTEGPVKFTIINATNETLYVYNYPTLEKSPTTPVTLAPGKPLLLALLDKPEVRIYFSNKPLSNTLEKGEPPDVFNYGKDATVTYSFMEYFYEPSNSRYNVNLSYVDDFSYPITITFSNVPSSYTGCEPGFEYGFSSLTAVKNALKSQTDYRWDALIWPAVVETDWDSDKYKGSTIDRIVGPNKVWPAIAGNGPWVPHSYKAFSTSLPKDDYQLFTNSTNWTGWQVLTQSDSPSPSGTGYVKALHSAAKADKNGKYGFYCYPKDDQTNVFAYVPDSTTCTVTIHPHDK